MSDTVGDLCPAFHGLVSFVYLDAWLEHRCQYNMIDWVLDSGAFSAMNIGKVIDVEEFTARARDMRRTDATLREVFALDIIGDWRASLKNCEYSWGKGVAVIPCFHPGEPWSALEHIVNTYPKIALGGVVRVSKQQKMAWFDECFARIWKIKPMRVHGFGIVTRDSLMRFPFHSVDATNWRMPDMMGCWYNDTLKGKAMNGKTRPSRDRISLRMEVEHYLKLQIEARHRWRSVMHGLDDDNAPTVRLALTGGKAEMQKLRSTPNERLARYWRKDS